jgi:Leu/Phe-tRNA-protein transferase
MSPVRLLFCQNSVGKQLIYKDFRTLVLIDCQQNTSHLASLGGREISRKVFVRHLRGAVGQPPVPWQFDKYALLETLRPPMLPPE